MSNSTAAGPSRGLLEILFGSKEPQEAEAGGQEFGGLMDLIKALNGKKDAEGQGADASRTLRETLSGKGIAESNVAGMPDTNAAFDSGERQLALMQGLQEREQQERLQRLAMLSGMPAQAMLMQGQVQAPVPPDVLQGVDPSQVNQVLRQKGLPPMNPQEMKLLQEVNGKIEQAKASEHGVELPPEFAVGAGAIKTVDPQVPVHPKAAIPVDRPVEPMLQKAMAAKGIDPKKLKEADSSVTSGTPEKIVTTEAYMQMHESVNAKGLPKEPVQKNSQSANAEPALPQQRAVESITAGAVAGTSQKGLELGSRKGMPSEPLSDSGKKAEKLDAAAGGAFGAAVAQSTEANRHDVYLPGADKPEQVRTTLLAEVGNGVALHAHKGGGEMRLVIHPDDMGEVKLKVGTKDGKVEVTVMADNEATAKLIRGGSKELESSLREQNLSLAKFEVSVGDTGSVVATDTKTSLNEQFLSQQNPQHSGGFSQASGDDGRSSRWSNDQGARQGGGYSPRAEEQQARSGPRAAPLPGTNQARALTGSRRLDVVA